jgi:hypothetical protein
MSVEKIEELVSAWVGGPERGGSPLSHQYSAAHCGRSGGLVGVLGQVGGRGPGEGFGTLDGPTLDVVTSTLERLAGDTDRVAGVVTHVPALAQRIPVPATARPPPSAGSDVRDDADTRSPAGERARYKIVRGFVSPLRARPVRSVVGL